MTDTKKEEVMQLENASDTLVYHFELRDLQLYVSLIMTTGQRCSASRTRLLAQRQASHSQTTQSDGPENLASLRIVRFP